MLDGAVGGSERRAHMRGPAPARQVCRASDGHSAERHQLEAAELEDASLVRPVKAFEDGIGHAGSHFHGRRIVRPGAVVDVRKELVKSGSAT